MVFSSTVFLFVFLPLVLFIYYLLDRRFKNIFLLLASLLFYAWGEPKFVFVMIISILINHTFALLIDLQLKKGASLSGDTAKKQKQWNAKCILVIAVLFNISLFFVYKYMNFSISNINRLLSAFGANPLPQTNIALPIGISFFTFQAMSYVFDIYYRRGQVQTNPLNTALYVSLFPQLIAGPIVRYETVAREINDRKETLEDFALGVKRFILGLGKKVILANSLAVLADYAFNQADYSALPVVSAWLGAVAYSLQIYYDFSGYSDMAIGLGLMFGFHFLKNFNYPYISGSVSEFWRRWHISLGSWFRDYVYIPLGGSRVKTKHRLILNLFVVWLLTGVWHGAAWNFILWGLMYFALLTFEKMTGIPEKWTLNWKKWPYRFFTLLMIMLGWVLFRANGIIGGLQYIRALFGLMGNTFADSAGLFLLRHSAVLLSLAIILCCPVLPWISETIKKLAHNKPQVIFTHAISNILYIVLFIASISFSVTSDYNPFIYFNF